LTNQNEKKDPPEALPELTLQGILNWIIQNWWLVLIILLLIIIIILIIIRTRHSPRKRRPLYLYYY